jgi:hypothetical protein
LPAEAGKKISSRKLTVFTAGFQLRRHASGDEYGPHLVIVAYFTPKFQKTPYFSEKDFISIAEIMLNDLKKGIEEKGIDFTFESDVVEFVGKESYSSKFGARNMRRYIQKNIEDEIANRIIEEYSENICSINLKMDNGNISVICK